MDTYIAIVDYGAGNLFSLKNALDYIGARSSVTSDPAVLEKSAAVLYRAWARSRTQWRSSTRPL